MSSTGRPRARRYWELSNAERLALPVELVSSEDATVLMTINHGRRVADYWPNEPTPGYLVSSPDGGFGAYAVTTTAILTAALFDGHSPDDVYADALHWLEEWFPYSLDDIARGVSWDRW